MASSNMQIPAMKGQMGAVTYFVTMIKMKSIPNYFNTYLDKKVDQAERKLGLDLQQDAQRRLNEKRVPEIAKYIQDTFDGSSKHPYVFNSITVNSEVELKFKPYKAGSDIGLLHINDVEMFTVADGQHRLMGIKRALHELSGDALRKFQNDSIAVVFFDVRHPKTKMRDISRMKQIFTDLNRNAAKPSPGVVVAMGNRPVEIITRRLIEEIPLFKGTVDAEKSSPSAKSQFIFSSKAIHDSVSILTNKFSDPKQIDSQYKRVFEVWTTLVSIMPDWGKAQKQELDPSILKRDYVSSHATVVRVISILLVKIWNLPPKKKAEALANLKQVNWKKTNPLFKSTILNERGNVMNSLSNQRPLVIKLSKAIGLEDDEAGR